MQTLGADQHGLGKIQTVCDNSLLEGSLKDRTMQHPDEIKVYFARAGTPLIECIKSQRQFPLFSVRERGLAPPPFKVRCFR